MPTRPSSVQGYEEAINQGGDPQTTQLRHGTGCELVHRLITCCEKPHQEGGMNIHLEIALLNFVIVVGYSTQCLIISFIHYTKRPFWVKLIKAIQS